MIMHISRHVQHTVLNCTIVTVSKNNEID